MAITEFKNASQSASSRSADTTVSPDTSVMPRNLAECSIGPEVVNAEFRAEYHAVRQSMLNVTGKHRETWNSLLTRSDAPDLKAETQMLDDYRTTYRLPADRNLATAIRGLETDEEGRLTGAKVGVYDLDRNQFIATYALRFTHGKDGAQMAINEEYTNPCLEALRSAK